MSVSLPTGVQGQIELKIAVMTFPGNSDTYRDEYLCDINMVNTSSIEHIISAILGDTAIVKALAQIRGAISMT